jgi:hypothetical protein
MLSQQPKGQLKNKRQQKKETKQTPKEANMCHLDNKYCKINLSL